MLEGDRLRVESFSVRAGEGRFTASGTLPLGTRGHARSIDWQAEKLGAARSPGHAPGGLRAKAKSSYDGKRVALNGELRADRGHFEFERDRLPTLGDDVVVIGQDRPPPQGQG